MGLQLAHGSELHPAGCLLGHHWTPRPKTPERVQTRHVTGCNRRDGAHTAAFWTRAASELSQPSQYGRLSSG